MGISYADDPGQAIAVLKDVLLQKQDVCQNPPPQIGIENFADSAILIAIRYWVPTKKYFQIMYQVNLAIHGALASAGITIPFPQQDVHLFNASRKDL